MFKSSQPYHRDLQSRGFVQGVTYTGTDLEPLCHYFGGIPYALPPVGLFRFHKPRPLPPDHQYGTRANPGNFTGGCGVCPQPGPAWNGDTSDSWDENCLQSNIWMPTGNPPAEGWPVLFWIHGGLLQWGTPNNLDLRALLSESPVQCIIVAPAYRLNLFGFLASPEISETYPDFASNLGFWDQRLALEWTHDNISYFGGNPSNITLSGYSAGSYSVFYQLAYDLSLSDEMAIAKRAIMSSNGPGTQPKSLSAAQHQFDELMEALEIPSSLSAHDKFVRLRNLDAMTLIEASTKMQQFQFRPVTDGSFVRHGLLNELSNGILAQRMRRRNVKLMNGECSDEWYVYGTLRPPKPGYDSMLHRLKADYSHEVCEVLMTHYFPNHELSPKYESWQAAFGHVYADVQICALNRGLVNALIKHGAGKLVHRYRIEWRAECVDKYLPKEAGVSHGSDHAIWFWGNGNALTAEEKKVITKAFHEPLSKFLLGEQVDWATRHSMQLRTLKPNGSVMVEEDPWIEEGLSLWNALEPTWCSI